MLLIDSHCHLDFPDFADDLEGVIARAREADVEIMQSISTRLSTFPALKRLAEAHDGVFCSIGVHPHQAGEEGIDDPAPILAETDHPKVIGIGESGLDYYYDRSPRDRQARSFRNHIKACQQSSMPLIVHSRDADDDTIEILRSEMEKAPFSGEIHCFSSGRALASAAIEMGLYLGIGGMLTFKRSDELRAIVADLPLDRLLLETDAPYLAPMPHRGKRNEPAYVAFVAEVLADVHEITRDEVARTTSENFFRLFTKAERRGTQRR
ncbi:MAG: TatD family hydrolase [Geminicoccaceae bacterium]